MVNDPNALSPLKQAYLAIEKLQARLSAFEQAKHEPVAVIGMGCRFPGGAESPNAFWDMLVNGVDAVTEVPAERWDVAAYYDPDPDAPGKMNTRFGAFLRQVDQFDPAFFGISPREAVSMDPQQRLLLEVAWEALENASQAPDQLSGSKTGVFVGIVGNDYAQMMHANGAIGSDTYYGSGIGHSIASGRISYVLGLQGPSISVDTACSSSLVALHLAVQSLRAGECRMALAGGSNAILTPEMTVALTKYHMLSPDGRCKTFDDSADGFVRGEGCGVVVLKRLSDALANEDNVLAIIRGSAVNQDGPSSGLTAPNGPSQEAVIREALISAGVKPDEVSFVETHGTGTSLGDPIEAQALGAVLGVGRSSDNPLLIGSVKTNIGHLEASSGIAGFIKLVLCIQHQAIPPHLHLKQPSRYIPWEQLPVRIPTELTDWLPDTGLIGGVSSFGFSGTNAHVIVAAPPACELQDVQTERPAHILNLSARSEKALKEVTTRFVNQMAEQSTPLADVAYTANTGRAALPYRLSVIADSSETAREKLAAFAAGEQAVITGQVHSTDQPRIACLFTGQGAQYVEMGRVLYDTQPTFREALNRCDEILRTHMDQSLLSVLFPDGEESSLLLHDTTYTQPALFAIEYALAELWRSWGIQPSAVMGHSVGEYVASCLAGVFSLEDGLRLIAARGRLMGALPAGGQMAAVLADESRVQDAIEPYSQQVAIAAYNGPQNIVISGVGEAVQAVLADLTARGIKSQVLKVSHAFHSPLMDAILDEFEHVASTITFSPPRLRLISNLTGELAMGAVVTNAAYWRRHLRESVQFARAMQTFHELGYTVFVEVGPHPTLIGMGQQCLPEDTGLWIPSLRRGKNDWQMLLHSAGELYVKGINLDWQGFDRDYPRRKLPLPTYPFQRARYWTKPAPRMVSTGGHPLIGQRLRSALKDVVQFESQLRVDSVPFLNDHRVYDKAILPATGYIEMALAAAQSILGDGLHKLEDLVIHEPLVVNEDETRTVQMIARMEDGSASFEIFSAGDDDADWRLHAAGYLTDASQELAPESESLETIRERCTESIAAETHYQQLSDRGLSFGASLHGVREIWRRDGEALGEIHLPSEAGAGAYQIHPALLDACLQVMNAALPSNHSGESAYLPMSLRHLRLYRRPGTQVLSHVTVHLENRASSDMLKADIRLLDENGALIGELDSLSLRRAGRQHLQSDSAHADWLYEVAWQADARGIAVVPEEIAEPVSAQFDLIAAEHNLDAYHETFIQVEALSTAYIIRAMQELGWRFTVGQHVSADQLADDLGIIPVYHRLLVRLLDILAEDGILKSLKNGWEVVQIPDVGNPTAQHHDLLERYPAARAQLTLTGNCGEHLASVFSGRVDPLELLFPGGSPELAESLYQDSPEAQVNNRMVREAVSVALSRLPAGQKLRILEVGGGTGGTTAWVAPMLPADRAEYLFTDIGALLVAKAREKFASYPFMQFQTLNLEQDLLAQDLHPGQFDLVLAVNVVHATADLRQTLNHIQQVLAPGGMLLMLEVAGFERWIDITFGLTEGWWRFTDTELRAAYPLLSRERWLELLTDTGFASVTSMPMENERSREVLLAAQMSQEATPRFDTPGDWLILTDAGGVGEQLASRLEAAGERALLVSSAHHPSNEHQRINPQNAADFRALLDQSADNERPLRGVIHLWSLDADTPAENEAVSLLPGQSAALGSLLYTVQALGARSFAQDETPRLWIVTRGAQAAGTQSHEPLNMAQTPIWGLGKVVALEYAELRPTCVDLDPASVSKSQGDSLFSEVAMMGTETQIALRADGRYLARLVRSTMQTIHVEDAPSVRLEKAASGIFDEMTLQPIARQKPGSGEVEILIYAAGLNFRDVMNALAMRDDPEPLGGECAGRIVSIGEGVTDFAIGDDVVAMGPGCFGTYTTTPASFVAHKPANISFDEAATLPFTFLTAHYSLNVLGKMSAGERILIHAAAGGVGLAAVQLAQQVGAEIFATAGSPEKRALLISLGVQHVMDSRSLDFSEQIRELTNGQGVDIILNSLMGDFIPASVSALADNGRFLEIGKRDLWTQDDFRRVRPHGQYYIIDLAVIRYDDPDMISAMFAELMEGVNVGDLRPLMYQTFPLESAADAFRYMAQAKHVGKIVLTRDNTHRASLDQLSPNASYLITGGLTGLGLLTARRMVDNGARHIVLMGRREPSETARNTIAEMEAAGAQIVVAQADVSRADEVARVLADIDTHLPPLRGVIHSAGVLEDAALMQQDWDRFARPLAPKVDGTWNLHALTRNKPLDFFVMYSSVASLLGSSGQGNHAAANAFEDALAYHRRAQGLPALSINWGAWSEIGAAAERSVDKRITEQGIGVIPPEQGLAVLEALMRGQSPQVGVFPVNWGVFLKQYGGGSTPAWMSLMAHDAQPHSAGRSQRVSAEVQQQGISAVLEAITQSPPNRQHDLLLAFVGEQVAVVLGAESAGLIDPRQPLNELGLDSLMAVELRNRLSAGLNLKRSLPATLVFDYPTLDALADYLAKEILGLEISKPMSKPEVEKKADAFSAIEDLSDEEIDRLFANKMRGS